MMRCKCWALHGVCVCAPELTAGSWWYLVICVSAALSFVAIWMYYGIKFFTWLTSEEIIKYQIEIPNPPGDGRVMEKPSIKVRATPPH